MRKAEAKQYNLFMKDPELQDAPNEKCRKQYAGVKQKRKGKETIEESYQGVMTQMENSETEFKFAADSTCFLAF